MIIKTWDFIKRHSVWILLAVIGVFISFPNSEEIQTIAMLLRAEALALILSMMGLFAYTKINFTKKLIKGEDGIITETEQTAFTPVIGHVFFGVHFLVGVYYLAVYITKFN